MYPLGRSPFLAPWYLGVVLPQLLQSGRLIVRNGVFTAVEGPQLANQLFESAPM